MPNTAYLFILSTTYFLLILYRNLPNFTIFFFISYVISEHIVRTRSINITLKYNGDFFFSFDFLSPCNSYGLFSNKPIERDYIMEVMIQIMIFF